MTNAEARFNKIHIRKEYACLAVTCHLHFLAEWSGFFTCYCGNTGGGTDTEVRVSTESRPWRRKFSRRSSRDSNPRPFNHESGALTTELSPPPFVIRGAVLDVVFFVIRGAVLDVVFNLLFFFYQWQFTASSATCDVSNLFVLLRVPVLSWVYLW